MSSTFSTINGVLTATITGTGELPYGQVSALITDSNGNKATAVEIEGYSTISMYSFIGTSSVTSITVGDSVTTLELYAFRGSSLSQFTIPATLTTINPRAFDQMSTLTSITVASGNTNYSSNNGVLFDYSGATLIKYPMDNTRTSYEIPAGVETIGFQAFRSASHLTSITMPSSVTSIETSAFLATGFTSINIPASDTSIGQSAFGSSGLTSITIPSSVTSLGSFAFTGAQALTSVIFEAGSQITTIDRYTFRNTGLTSINIPASVTSIGNNAFNSASSLTSITIPASVTSIESYAFSSTSSLTWVAFEENSQLTTSGLDATVFNLSSVATIYASQPLIDTMGWTRSDSTDPPTLNNIGNKSDITVSTDQPPAQAPPSPICFPAGTPVTTDQGLIAIEKLNTDKHTIRGKEIVAITQTRPLQKHIVCFKTDSLSKNVPSQETCCSMEHKVFYKREMMKARDIVKLCENVSFIPYNGETLYNVLLKKQDKMMINNLICETLDPKNIMAKISTIKDGQKKSKAIQELTKILKNNNIPEFHKLYASL
mgnify:CR=1 FL=1